MRQLGKVCTSSSLLALSLFPLSVVAQITGASDFVEDGAELRRVATGFAFTEGPAAARDGSIFFTDQPNNRIMRWEPNGEVGVYLEDAGRANGLYVDDDGNLLACADENGQLWRISPAKEIEVLLADPDGRQLNGPNDLWLAADGGIYFTDPYYQRDYWTRSEADFDTQNVFYLSP